MVLRICMKSIWVSDINFNQTAHCTAIISTPLAMAKIQNLLAKYSTLS